MALILTLFIALTTGPPLPADGWSERVSPAPIVVPADPMIMAVAVCESENRNVKNKRSSASGPWQFLDSTWEWVTGLEPPAMAYPRSIQRAAFIKLWDGGKGRSHWNPSKHCWGKAYQHG